MMTGMLDSARRALAPAGWLMLWMPPKPDWWKFSEAPVVVVVAAFKIREADATDSSFSVTREWLTMARDRDAMHVNAMRLRNLVLVLVVGDWSGDDIVVRKDRFVLREYEEDLEVMCVYVLRCEMTTVAIPPDKFDILPFFNFEIDRLFI